MLDEHCEQGGRQKGDQRPQLRGDHGERLRRRTWSRESLIHSLRAASAEESRAAPVCGRPPALRAATADQGAPHGRHDDRARRRAPARGAAGRPSAAGCPWPARARAPCRASASCCRSRPTAGRTSAASTRVTSRQPPMHGRRRRRSCAPGRRSCRCAARRSAASASRSSASCRTALRAASVPCHGEGSRASAVMPAAGPRRRPHHSSTDDTSLATTATATPPPSSRQATAASSQVAAADRQTDEQVRRPGQRRVGAGEEQLLEHVAATWLGDRRRATRGSATAWLTTGVSSAHDAGEHARACEPTVRGTGWPARTAGRSRRGSPAAAS